MTAEKLDLSDIAKKTEHVTQQIITISLELLLIRHRDTFKSCAVRQTYYNNITRCKRIVLLRLKFSLFRPTGLEGH